MNREDFILLNSDIIYFDNAATTLKPYILSQTISDYYNNYSANKGRGVYDLANKVDNVFEQTRESVKRFINAKDKSQISFTNNATDSINKIVLGYFKNKLKKDDEVLITVSEHASLVLPWFNLAKEIGIKVKYIPLDEEHKVIISNVEKSITDKTKVIAISHITNVVGDIRPIKEIVSLAHRNGIEVLIDGAQSVPHLKIDISDIDADFLVFSAHKMLGPTGLGIIYQKNLVINPVILGGGMNEAFDLSGNIIYKDYPILLEAGTPNIADVIGFNASINYLNKIGMKNIEEYENKLRLYLLNKLKEIDDIIIYNENSESGIITFNIKDIDSSYVSKYLNKYKICIRSGAHCAKILKEDFKINNTCRISLYFYNTYSECDKFIEALKMIKNSN